MLLLSVVNYFTETIVFYLQMKALKSAAVHVKENIRKMEAERGEKRNKVGIADQKNRLREYNLEIRYMYAVLDCFCVRIG